MSNNKLKQLRKKLLSLSEDEYNSLLDTSEDKPQWQWDMSSRQKNVPKLQSHKDSIKAAVVKRKTNPSWVATRGIQHEINSNKVKAYKIIYGEGKWNSNQKHIDTYRPGVDEPKGNYFVWKKVLEKEYIGTYNSQHECAKALAPDPSKVSSLNTIISKVLITKVKVGGLDLTFEYEQ